MTLRQYAPGGLILIAVLAFGILSPPTGAQETAPIQQWSQDAWTLAQSGETSSLTSHLMTPPTESSDSDAVATYLAALERFKNNAASTAAIEAEALAAASASLQTETQAENLAKALDAAIEVQTLLGDYDDALSHQEIRDVIEWAERDLPAIIQDRDWLQAQDILYRLRTIFEDTDQVEEFDAYDDRLDEVNRRVRLLANYAPRRLYELRVLLAERRGDEPPAAFFQSTSNRWEQRTRDITADIVRLSLDEAASEHIGQTGWGPLLDGGLDAMVLVAGTTGLSEPFAGIGDNVAVDTWSAGIDDLRHLTGQPLTHRDGRRLCRRILESLSTLNAETIQVPEEVIFREFGNGAAEALDQFSAIIWPDDLRRFDQQTSGEFIGVGVLIRENEKSEIMIVSPLEGTPAYRQGVKPDDIIEQVDGVQTVGWTLNDAVDEITGPRGTTVTLGLRRSGEEDLLQVPIVRDLIKLQTVKGWWNRHSTEDGSPVWDWYIDPANRIGYIRLTQFSNETYRDLIKALAQIEAQGWMNGLILDLRFNPGGLLTAACEISNLWVHRGVVVTGEDKEGNQSFAMPAQPQSLLAGVPTVILVNKGSASASEIVSGCVQAHEAGLILGERSFGKGSVQTVHRIGPDAKLKLTTQYYRLPPDSTQADEPGRLVHRIPGSHDWGVNPDVVVQMSPEQVKGSVELRRKADMIPLDEDPTDDVVPEPRPSIDGLLQDGLDPQLEMALLILQARALADIDAQHTQAKID